MMSYQVADRRAPVTKTTTCKQVVRSRAAVGARYRRHVFRRCLLSAVMAARRLRFSTLVWEQETAQAPVLLIGAAPRQHDSLEASRSPSYPRSLGTGHPVDNPLRFSASLKARPAVGKSTRDPGF